MKLIALTGLLFFTVMESCSGNDRITQVTQEYCNAYKHISCFVTDGSSIWLYYPQ